MRRLLFVDDTVDTLTSLRQTLSHLQDEWTMEFVQSGREALTYLKANPVDVVLSDLTMPGMDGTELLGTVGQQYPHVVRIAFTGDGGQVGGLRSAGVAHQFLTKPFSAEDLKKLVDRACDLRDLLKSESIRRLVSGIKTLPSLPGLYRDVMAEIQSADPSIKKVAKLISRDIGMVTKILQIVNSAYFGLRTRVSNPEQAVLLLGLDTIKSLVLSLQVFTQFEESQTFFSLEVLWRHSLTTSSYARAIAMEVGGPPPVIEDTLAAALLHDVGTLVLAANMPDKYSETLALQQNEGLSEWEAEREVLGATHAEMGGYLLGMWGLSDPLVEAVTYHHTPSMCRNEQFSPLMAVHVADAFEQEDRAQGIGVSTNLIDDVYLEQCGFMGRLSVWRALCRKS